METQFKIGDRVTRDETDLIDNWSSKTILHGVVVRVYDDYESKYGPYPELYEVKWDNGNKFNKGYLPNGLQHETK